jgi:hypothetical protein
VADDSIYTAGKCKPRGIPFKKGKDKRRNGNGRPRSFDELRSRAQKIACEIVPLSDDKESPEYKKKSIRLDRTLRKMAESEKNCSTFIEIAYGKVPNEVKIDATVTGKGEIKHELSIESAAEILRGFAEFSCSESSEDASSDSKS